MTAVQQGHLDSTNEGISLPYTADEWQSWKSNRGCLIQTHIFYLAAFTISDTIVNPLPSVETILQKLTENFKMDSCPEK